MICHNSFSTTDCVQKTNRNMSSTPTIVSSISCNGRQKEPSPEPEISENNVLLQQQPVQNTDPMNCTVWSVHQTLFVGNPKELWQPKRGIQMVLLVFEEEQDSKQVVV